MLRVVEFKQEYRGKKAVDMVLLAPAGEAYTKTQSWHRVDDLRPPENMDPARAGSDSMMAMRARWDTVSAAYDAWRKGNEIPENGIPLSAWSGVTADQADILKSMSIRTVEDVAAMSESTFTKLPFPNARQLPGLASEFLKGADAAEKDAQIAEMRERMAAMEEMLEKRTAPESEVEEQEGEAA